jgi:hypothetical protein
MQSARALAPAVEPSPSARRRSALQVTLVGLLLAGRRRGIRAQVTADSLIATWGAVRRNDCYQMGNLDRSRATAGPY